MRPLNQIEKYLGYKSAIDEYNELFKNNNILSAYILALSILEDSIISLKNVNKWFGEFHVLKDVDLEVKKKERIVVCGPSGSGKSTMIRCINRLEEHQEGTIIVDGIELTGNLKNIDSVRKEVGMVFQQFNLFPHLSVKEILLLLQFGLKKCLKLRQKN